MGGDCLSVFASFGHCETLDTSSAYCSQTSRPGSAIGSAGATAGWMAKRHPKQADELDLVIACRCAQGIGGGLLHSHAHC